MDGIEVGVRILVRETWGLDLENDHRQGKKTGYNWIMIVAVFAMRLLEVMFFLGLIGSAVVVLISFVEDGKELFGKD